MRVRPYTAVAAVAAIAIVVAAALVRLGGPADPAAVVSEQRAAVERFHRLVADGRWDDVYRATADPPGRDAAAFAALMREQVAEHGEVVAVRIDELRLLRSRAAPLLEVHEIVTLRSPEGRPQTETTVSYFARRGTAWLFAFSSGR